MRTVFLILFLSISYLSFGQHRTFERSETIESQLPKEELFKNAQTWIAESYKSYKNVVQLEDKDAGKIILNGAIASSLRLYYDYRYSITIQVKDKKYKYTIDKIEIRWGVAGSIYSYSGEQNFDRLERRKKILDSLDNVDKENLSNREKRKIDEEHNKIKLQVEETITVENEINRNFDRIVQSLKSSMSQKDDF